MREIKFRAWDKINNIMMFPDVIWNYEEKLRAGYLNSSDNYLWRGDILMQYTGLKDKNEVEIYEGDIVKYIGFDNKEYTGYVEFFNGSFIMKHKIGYSTFTQSGGAGDQVIGNIYQNPDLIK